ncbi:Crp/Fnr family transcriptional regulator [Sandaracinobacter sp. RS1-74]|uniref:Crp/Fnr family transcriptional regulator n=1 Tax=Sandaracinobacteroides sayramensis TaxID=2913411 RepID=UPI001EDA72EB|nr:Crp/Fnr family transcriptional regulator [Sandaracinobacteroides sayramensis]MCG2839567.1 Crp/Fnr family transcriptional regulator [Sandaracinobacteroides sayramensis]
MRTGIRKDEADAIVANNGWLLTQPADFREEVLRHSVLMHFEAGQTVFRIGDAPGGIYGLVRGNATVNTAPPNLPPKLLQGSLPGYWTGEASFLTRQPRRVELQVRMPTWLLHLPLSQMNRMAYDDPRVIRNFSHILVATLDIATRIISDLQQLNPARRLAATLDRAAASGSDVVMLTQAELGEMACASRRQVNRVLGEFEERGWVRLGYGGFTILDLEALRRFAYSE